MSLMTMYYLKKIANMYLITFLCKYGLLYRVDKHMHLNILYEPIFLGEQTSYKINCKPTKK